MTDFMTALHFIFAQLTCPGDPRVKGVQFQSTSNLCRESHKTQVWLCFLVMSLLSISACAASDAENFQVCFKVLRKRNEVLLQKSDAMLYAPSVDEIENNCEYVSLKCYMEELTMVLTEEQIIDGCIFSFNRALKPHANGCPACETYSPKNITIFLERLDILLQRIITKRHM